MLAVALLAALVVLGNLAWKDGCGETLEGQYLDSCYSDVPALWFSERLDQGAVPYVDHPVEYPVLTGVTMWVAAQPADDHRSFHRWTGLLLAASAAVAAGALARALGAGRGLVLAAAPTLAVSATVNWDLPAVLFATLGLLAHRRDRDAAAGVWLGLGTAMKLWPGLALLALVPSAWAQRGRRAGLVTAGSAGGVWLAVNLPVMVTRFDAWSEFLRLNRERAVDWDPTWALVSRATGWEPSIAFVNVASAVLFALGAAVIVAATVRRTTPDRWHHAVLPVVTWFLLTSKVWSPQFSLWLLPLFAVTFPGWRWWAGFGVADVAVTLTRFPYLANFVGIGATVPFWPFGTALTVRTLVLVPMVWLAWRRSTTSG